MTCRVFCTFQFEAWHSWTEAPARCNYLAARHRHLFHVRAERAVGHADREIEFVEWKRDLEARVVAEAATGANRSCEQWCEWMLAEFQLDRVEVSEDGENGAVCEG